ncbi:MAG TPA: YicC/YloC family endoribonuclease [Beijerinckia sp.]|nr:YicC/YloC family endoribonuclease [Beijerinckia sp.]
MNIASMTGFARVAGHLGPYRWAWELKSVNAKGLDLRLRLPPGFDSIEVEARARLGRRLTRGTCYATLTAQRETATPEVRVNRDLLQKLVAALGEIPLSGNLQGASLDGLLAVRGVVEISESGEDESEKAKMQAATLASLDAALDALVAMRLAEGEALARVFVTRLDRIAALTHAAETCPARKPEAIRDRLAQTIAALAGNSNFDQNRLHQEALLLAAKADVREELDRLVTHVSAVCGHLEAGGAVGRRLDFLAQELAREANTLCAKSNDASLTSLGLELRVEIEQFREQIQNIE